MTAGRLVNDILEAMNRRENNDARRKVWDIMRLELNEICKEFSVAELRDTISIDFSSALYSTGMLLPSDVLGVDMVRDSDEIEYIERNQADIENNKNAFRFYRYHTSADGLFFGDDCSITNGGTSFTSAALTADGQVVDSEYVRFGENEAYYKVSTDTSPFTFTPTYWGDTGRDVDFYVRPPETQRMVLLDKDGDELTDRTITVYYWKAPRAIYRPSDRIPLVSTEALTLRILRRMPEAKERRPVNNNEVMVAMRKLKNINPNFPRSPAARGEDNKVVDFATNPFDERD